MLGWNCHDNNRCIKNNVLFCPALRLANVDYLNLKDYLPSDSQSRDGLPQAKLLLCKADLNWMLASPVLGLSLGLNKLVHAIGPNC